MLLLAGLPIAFSVRKQLRQTGETDVLRGLVGRPEQVFFFAPLALVFVWVPVALRAGMMTVGWSTLGVLCFLFALAVGLIGLLALVNR